MGRGFYFLPILKTTGEKKVQKKNVKALLQTEENYLQKWFAIKKQLWQGNWSNFQQENKKIYFHKVHVSR